MANKLKSDYELQHCAEAFFRAVRNSGRVDPEKFVDFMNDGKLKACKGLLFYVDADLLSAEYQLASRCIKLLGPKVVHEDELLELAWDFVSEGFIESTTDSYITGIVSSFLKELYTHTQRHFTWIAPNHVIRFQDQPRKISIGPVEAVATSELLLDLEEFASGGLSVIAGEKFNLLVDGNMGSTTVSFPPVSWRITTNAAQRNVQEEATWLINIAVSFLRLSWPANYLNDVLFPTNGAVEALPTSEHIRQGCGITISSNDDILIGGPKNSSLYVVDDSVFSISSTEEFKVRAHAIFNPKKGSLADRFGQGLGWLTRGRQATDRAERFLFFFTAIETLLSSNDKTAPVVQTIARYTAVILQDKISMRSELTKAVKAHYEARSALVHAGKRNVSRTDANTIQLLAESLYRTVMERIQLTISFDDFHNSLSEASHGLTWPITEPAAT